MNTEHPLVEYGVAHFVHSPFHVLLLLTSSLTQLHRRTDNALGQIGNYKYIYDVPGYNTVNLLTLCKVFYVLNQGINDIFCSFFP